MHIPKPPVCYMDEQQANTMKQWIFQQLDQFEGFDIASIFSLQHMFIICLGVPRSQSSASVNSALSPEGTTPLSANIFAQLRNLYSSHQRWQAFLLLPKPRYFPQDAARSLSARHCNLLPAPHSFHLFHSYTTMLVDQNHAAHLRLRLH